MNKLFDSIKEGSDPRNRIVFICKDANGMYVFKPGSGFKSRHYSLEEAFELADCFDRQCNCGHAHAFYAEGERPAANEQYPAPGEAPVVEAPVVEAPVVKMQAPKKATTKKASNKKAKAKK